MEHGKSAFGARYVRSGYSFSEEQDLRYALGWPWMRQLSPALAADTFTGQLYDPWPIDWAPALTRSLALDWFDSPITTSTLATCRFGEPLTADEGRELIRARFLERPTASYTGALLLTIEALLGPDLVVDSVVEALEAMPTSRADLGPVDLAAGLFMFGFVLLRVEAARHDDAARRLQALLDRKSLGIGGIPRQLDRILNGREGALRSAELDNGKMQRADLQHVHHDAGFVAERLVAYGAPKSHDRPMARVVFLGGDAALDHEIAVWKKYADKSQLVKAYGDIRSPKIVALFAEIAHATKAKQEALDWFEQHRDYALPILRESKSAAAAAMVKRLG